MKFSWGSDAKDDFSPIFLWQGGLLGEAGAVRGIGLLTTPAIWAGGGGLGLLRGCDSQMVPREARGATMRVGSFSQVMVSRMVCLSSIGVRSPPTPSMMMIWLSADISCRDRSMADQSRGSLARWAAMAGARGSA